MARVLDPGAARLVHGPRDAKEHLRLREHEADELSHYSKRTVDIEYRFPFTDWGELEGIANRTDFDLKQHEKVSGQDLTYFDQEKEERYHPYVIEPAAGVDRALLAFLIDAYAVDEAPSAKGEVEKRTVLRFHKDLAPIEVAVLPLSRNEQLAPDARAVFDVVKQRWMAQFDDAGAIGRRYRRQDEIGTPFCVTIDFDTLEDRQVTVQERDTMTQDRIRSRTSRPTSPNACRTATAGGASSAGSMTETKAPGLAEPVRGSVRGHVRCRDRPRGLIARHAPVDRSAVGFRRPVRARDRPGARRPVRAEALVRLRALLVASAIGLAACTGSAPPPGPGDDPTEPPAPVPASPESESPAPEGPGPLAAARRLCRCRRRTSRADPTSRPRGRRLP